MTKKISFDALGTQWNIIAQSKNNTPDLRSQILKKVQSFESMYSRFDKNSVISKLSEIGQIQNPSTETIDILEYGLAMYKETRGAIDISIGAELENSGYGKPSGGTRSGDITQDLVISDKVIKLAEGVRIDLGAYGKGWLIDNVGKYLESLGIKDYVINGGGDVLVGNEAKQMRIQNPLQPDLYLGSITVSGKALAASSNLLRTWVHDGNHHSHIPDASGSMLCAYVLAEKARDADAIATYAMIADASEVKLLARQKNAEILLIKADKTVSYTEGIVFTAAN